MKVKEIFKIAIQEKTSPNYQQSIQSIFRIHYRTLRILLQPAAMLDLKSCREKCSYALQSLASCRRFSSVKADIRLAHHSSNLL